MSRSCLPSRIVNGIFVGGSSVKWKPMRDCTTSGCPLGIRCSSRSMSVPASRRQAIPSATSGRSCPGVQPSRWPKGNCASNGVTSSKPGAGSRASSVREAGVGSSRMLAWWMTLGFDAHVEPAPRTAGWNSRPSTNRVSSIGIGIANLRKTSSPSACSRKGSGISITRSGSPSRHAPNASGSGGRWAGSPAGAPASTHLAIRAIWASLNRRSPMNGPPYPGTGFQGVIDRLRVACLMARAQGRASR